MGRTPTFLCALASGASSALTVFGGTKRGAFLLERGGWRAVVARACAGKSVTDRPVPRANRRRRAVPRSVMRRLAAVRPKRRRARTVRFRLMSATFAAHKNERTARTDRGAARVVRFSHRTGSAGCDTRFRISPESSALASTAMSPSEMMPTRRSSRLITGARRI